MDRREAEAVLGASHLCTPKELAKCYRKKALLAHPDKGGSEAQFQRISDAYAALVAAYEASRSADAEPEACEVLLRYRVSGKKGALVREGASLDSRVVGTLAHGSLATVFEADGRAATTMVGDKVRIRVAFPLAGYVSATAVQPELDFLSGQPSTLKAAIRRAGRAAAKPPSSFKSFLAAGSPRPPKPPPAPSAASSSAVAKPAGAGDGSFSSFVSSRRRPNAVDLAEGVAYHRGVLSAADADALMTRLVDELPWRVHSDDFGEQGRPTFFCGDDGCAFAFVGCKHDPNPWPPALDALRPSLEAKLGIPRRSLTACLLNNYPRGAGHIPFHSDEVRAHGHKRIVASLSLGGPRAFRLRCKKTKDEIAALKLEPGSVLLMTGDAQDKFEHELPLDGGADPPRVSCTFRSIVPGFEEAWAEIHDPED